MNASAIAQLDRFAARSQRHVRSASFRCCQWFSLMLACLIAIGCDSSEMDSTKQANATSSKSWSIPFVDRAAEMGIDFRFRDGQESGHFTVLETIGGGIGVLDLDRDGNDDIVAAGGGYFGPKREILGHPLGIYRNLGQWQMVTASGAIPSSGPIPYNTAVAATDYDHDGFDDFLICGYGEIQLYRNLGDGTFEEVSVQAGLVDPLWSTGAGWGDFNGDGNLDLYVVHYLDWSWENDPPCNVGSTQLRDVCPPGKFSGVSDIVFFGNGDGTFHQDDSKLGEPKRGKGLGLVVADLDRDLDLDIYVGNDTTENLLYRNDGAGDFSEVGWETGVALGDRGVPDGSMGVHLGDYNLDGHFDLWTTNFENENNTLYRNHGNGSYTTASRMAGMMALGNLYVGWGTSFFDADLDGDEDLLVINGHLTRHPTRSPIEQLAMVLENQNGKKFINRADACGPYFGTAHVGRGAVVADLDRDGDLDAVVSHINSPIAILENKLLTNASKDSSAIEHQWLELDLVGTRSPRRPVGTVVTLKMGDSTQVRQLVSGGSYASSLPTTIHFGITPSASSTVPAMGKSSEKTEARVAGQVIVQWPSGARTELSDVAVNQRLLIVEP